jgi:hypothetical protein
MAHVVRAAALLFFALAGTGIAQHYSWERTILNPSPSQTAEFGLGLAPRGTDLLIGVPDYVANDVPGKLGLFDLSGSVIRPYPNPTLDGGDLFGAAVATLANDVLVGAPRDDAAGIDAGAAYLLDGDTAALLHSFADPSPSLYFGSAVAGGGGLAYVGDPQSQSVHVYDPGSGTLLGSLGNPAPLEGGGFGRAIAVSPTTVAVGAPGGKGAVHLFDAATGAAACRSRAASGSRSGDPGTAHATMSSGRGRAGSSPPPISTSRILRSARRATASACTTGRTRRRPGCWASGVHPQGPSRAGRSAGQATATSTRTCSPTGCASSRSRRRAIPCARS